MKICEYEKCTNEVTVVAGKQQRQFCSDKCRKASKRAQLRKSEATASPTADKLRTISTKLPTSDTNCGQALHPAIVAEIDRLSMNIDPVKQAQEKVIRTALATDYQRMYPDKQYTGIGIAPMDMLTNPIPVRVSVSLPGDEDYLPLCKTTREWLENKERGGGLK